MRNSGILLMIIFFSGCIDPIDLKVPGVGGTLVVDGWITNQPGPYTIKLSRTIAYDNSQPLKVYSVPEMSAKVSIVDDLGNTENLVATTTAGSYKTNAMTGMVGRSYQLLIQTSNGSSYRSSFEEMLPVPKLESVQAIFQVSEVLFINANGSARVLKKEDFGIYVSINDPGDTDNFYRWTADGIFEFFSINDNPDIKQCWAPKPSRVESKLELASDLYFNGKSYNQYIGLIPYDRPTMYLVHVRQQSLTESAYEFLKKISNQQTSTGTLFDPPPNAIAGNLYNEKNKDEVVLGYFGASAEIETSLLINRFVASGYVNPSRYTPPRQGDCRTMEPAATNVKPPGF